MRWPHSKRKINVDELNVIIIFLAHWYFIPRGVKTKQIGEISYYAVLCMSILGQILCALSSFYIVCITVKLRY